MQITQWMKESVALVEAAAASNDPLEPQPKPATLPRQQGRWPRQFNLGALLRQPLKLRKPKA